MELTNRENDVALLVSKGADRNLIAHELSISLSTVDKLVRSLKTKLGAANQSELVIKSAHHIEAGNKIPDEHTIGTLRVHDNEQGQEHERPPGFADAKDFDGLFSLLHDQLAPFGITHIVHSHIGINQFGAIEHFHTRWSMPAHLQFDNSIPPNENLAYRHAMTNWEPAPLDLEMMVASEFYDFVPENIRKQNDIFIQEGLIRGVTITTPGLNHQQRLVTSLIMQNAPPEALGTLVQKNMSDIHFIVSAFRNAHVGLATTENAIGAKQKALLEQLIEGHAINEAATHCDISRRAADRYLSEVRDTFNVRTNIAAIAAYLSAKSAMQLPF